MKDENKLRITGALLRIGYDVFKKNTIDSDNKSYLDVLEACGKGIRASLENDPEFNNIYQGSDIIKALEELYNSIKKAFNNE